MTEPFPTILIADSGLGGLTVFAEIRKALPRARFVYVADNAGFPYGRLSGDDLVARVVAVMDRLVPQYRPDLAVIACNTASTLVLPHLRQHFTIPFVGTVPAIKPAAALTQTKRFTVLATPGTVARDYTHDLIETFAKGCDVTLIGSQNLAAFAEAEMRCQPVSDAEILAELVPCFIDDNGRRTDVVTLGCTHYPLLLKRFRMLAPWPVTFLDPAPAIARRVLQLIGPTATTGNEQGKSVAVFTAQSGADNGLHNVLAERGLPHVIVELMPLPVRSAPVGTMDMA